MVYALVSFTVSVLLFGKITGVDVNWVKIPSVELRGKCSFLRFGPRKVLLLAV